MVTIQNLIEYIGKFHPLVVHFPIAIYLCSWLVAFVSYWPRYNKLKEMYSFLLLLSAITALLSSGLGYMLSFAGEYDLSLLQNHQYSGIAFTILIWLQLFIFLHRERHDEKWRTAEMIWSTLCCMFLGYAGHAGGTLTHGKGYLDFQPRKPIHSKPKTIDSVMVFEHIISPVLEKKCVACHQSEKRKGRLNLENLNVLLKGGKSGPALIQGNAAKSELTRRINLPHAHDEHMPPEGKTSLTSAEINLLNWWITEVRPELNQPFLAQAKHEDHLSYVVNAFNFDPVHSSPYSSTIPVPDIAMSDSIKNLCLSAGFEFRVLNQKPVLLDLSAVQKNIEPNLELLIPIRLHIIRMQISNQKLNDNAGETISQFENLEFLKLNQNKLTDLFLDKIQSLKSLKSINLNQNAITADGLHKLKNLESLETIYVWNTLVDSAQIHQDWGRVKVIDN